MIYRIRTFLLLSAALSVMACRSGGKVQEETSLVENSSLVMMFEQKDDCDSPCPDYSIEIHGDGSVRYSGSRYVAIHGERRYQLSPLEVNVILGAFDRVGFEHLQDWYPPGGTDLPYEIYTLSRNGKKKRVIDGQRLPALRHIFDAFDSSGRGAQWARGNRETVPALRREGFDFQSREAGAVLTRAAILGTPELVRDLLEERVPLNVEIEFPWKFGCLHRHEATARMLAKVGARAGSCYR